jgi:hypothetical protein
VNVAGWKELRLIQAGSAETDRYNKSGALKEIAVNVRLGLCPPTTPVLVGRKEATGGYPDLIVCVPFDHETIADWRRGDRGAAAEIAEELEHAAQVYVNQVRLGRVN